MQKRSATFLFLGFLLVLSFGAVLLDLPPSPAPSTAPPQEFSAERAFVYISDFAQKPHPIGTPEHDRVRDNLLAQIASLFLTPEVQRATGVTDLYQAAGRIENILVRLSGVSGSSDAVLLAAHYDSVPAGPGAADDGCGVATLLETLRNLSAASPLRNDIILLFSDGEEDGMLGASAFAKEHPWAKDVRVVINFEAQGTSGPPQLVEMSSGNGRLIQVLTRAVSLPHTSSLTYEIYKRMPNDSDVTVLKTIAAALNIAFIGNSEAHQTPLDNPEHLNKRSLQQSGEYALSLARAFGNADLTQLSAADAAHFSIPDGLPSGSLPTRVWLLDIFAIAAFLALALYANRVFGVHASTISLSMLASVEMLIALGIASFVFVETVSWLHLDLLPPGDVVRSTPYGLSLIALLLALESAFYKLLRRQTFTWFGLLLGRLAFLLALTLVSSVLLPGGSYLFAWPLLAAVPASFFVAIHSDKPSRFEAGALCLLSLPALLFFMPLLRGIHQALGLTPLGAPLLAVVLGILILALTALEEVLLTVSGNWLPIGAFGIACLLFAFAASSTRYSAAHPKPSMLKYALDTDAGKALWASSADRPDDWTAQYVGTSPARGKLNSFYPTGQPIEYFLHDAPVLSLPPPRVELLKSSVIGDSRMLRLRLTSPRNARALSVEVPESDILEGWVDDRKLAGTSESRWNKNGKWGLEYANVPAQGIALNLHAKGVGRVKLVVVDRSLGLPEIPGAAFAPRPADSMAQHSGDETLVRRTLVF